MLERIKHEKTIDVYGHVTCLRAQRNYMVQTEDQYTFIHDALLEAVMSGFTEVRTHESEIILKYWYCLFKTPRNANIWKYFTFFKVPCRSLHHHIQQLMQTEPGENMQTGMELEFKKLANVQTETDRFVSANLPVNKFKNRLVNILPYESSRVCLQPMRGIWILSTTISSVGI